jgi:predicted nucleotidyltransferase
MNPSASLHQHLEEVREVFSRYPVRNPRIFGSAARGEDSGKSDLDILVEPGEQASFYDLAKLELELEAILGCKVDVLTPDGLGPDVARRMAADLRPL